MKKIIFFILFLYNYTPVISQPNIDSLYTLWQNDSLSDSSRVMAYHDYLQFRYLFSNPDTTITLAENLHQYASNSQYIRAAAQGYRLQGIANAVLGNYPKSEELFKKSLDIFEQIDYQPGVANSLKNLGNISIYQGNRPKALAYSRNALSIFEQLGDQKGIGSSLDNLGNIYYQQENYEAALKYAQRSLEIYEQFEDKPEIAGRLSNIASIYWNQEKYALALDYNQKALDIYTELDNKNGIALIKSNNGAIHLKLGNDSESLKFAMEALSLYEKLGNKKGIADNSINIGSIYYVRNSFSKALNYCKRGLKIANEIGSLKLEKNACSCLYDVNKAKGKGTQALQYLERKELLEDSLKTRQTGEELQQMEFEKIMVQDSIADALEAKRIDETYQQEVRKKNQTRNILIAASLLLLFIVGGLFKRWRHVRKTKDSIEKEKNRSDNLILNILPADIAEELKEKGEVKSRKFDDASILFTDFEGFTKQSSELSASDLVEEINQCFKAFDAIMEKYGIEKIKTIGDAYMAAGGLFINNSESIKNTILAGLEMQDFIMNRFSQNQEEGKPAFQMRLGIHTGPVVAGIIGVKKFQYDVWGDTVNTANRLESKGQANMVNISEATYQRLKDDPDFEFERRGKIDVKGKGEIEMYFVSKRK